MGLFQDIQQLPDVFLAEGDGFTVVEDETGDAHHIVGFPKLREVVDIKYLCGNVFVFRGNSLGCGDQLGAHGAVQGHQYLHILLSQAVDAFLAMREAEGARLCEDICAKKASLEACVPTIEALSKEDTNSYAAKLESRLRQVLEDHELHIEESRILTECAIFADKVAVDEETVRLRSHFKAFDEMLLSEEPIGRKLDFLIQEMNRETNTIGSKANDMRIAKSAIEMKNEIEKIREQIQNIE